MIALKLLHAKPAESHTTMPVNIEDLIPQARHAPASAAVYQRVRLRMRNLRSLQKFGQEHKDPKSILPTSSDAIRKLEQQHFPSSSPTSRLNVMTDDKLVQEALQARNWLFGILDCHDQLFGREREMRMFRVAVEKELAGGEGEWSGKDMEKLYMALTHCKLTSPEDRLKAAFALVLHLNFAEHLKDVSELAAIRTARTHRAAPMDAEIEETRELIFEKARLIKVDQFACAIPLSVLTTVSTPSTIDDNAGCCPICQSSYNDLSAFPISELLADYPVRIKHCGHIIGKACLAQWMVTPKIDEAKYPHRTCPMCRVEIEGVDAFEKPDSLLQWLRKDRRAIETVKDLVYGYGLEFEECCDVVVQTMSEDIACEELMAEVRKMRSKREDDGAFEKEEAFLKETMDDLKKEKWAWGFRGDGVWRKLRQEWMNTSAISKG